MKHDNENWKDTSIYDFIKHVNQKKGCNLNIDLNKVIHEGWSIGAIINDLQPSINIIMNGQSWVTRFKSVKELKAWIIKAYPEYTDVDLTDVLEYFRIKYKLINK